MNRVKPKVKKLFVILKGYKLEEPPEKGLEVVKQGALKKDCQRKKIHGMLLVMMD